MYGHALIIDFEGIGNVFITYPILSELNRFGMKLTLQDNPVWRDADLTRLLPLRVESGFIPPLWRRFGPGDWDEIDNVIRERGITHVFNLRNEGPYRGKNYMAFKQRYKGQAIEFWDLHSLHPMPRIRHYEAMLKLFHHHGLDLSSADRHWLRGLRAAPPAVPEVGFFLGASQQIKRWPPANWRKLAERVLRETDCRLVLMAGATAEERVIGLDLYQSLAWDPGRIKLVIDRSLGEVLGHLAELSLLVSGDSMATHMAAALQLPAVGLYTATDGSVWGGASDMVELQSPVALRCPRFKHDTGNCEMYEGDCEKPCADAVDPDTVVDALLKLIDAEQPTRNYRTTLRGAGMRNI